MLRQHMITCTEHMHPAGGCEGAAGCQNRQRQFAAHACVAWRSGPECARSCCPRLHTGSCAFSILRLWRPGRHSVWRCSQQRHSRCRKQREGLQGCCRCANHLQRNFCMPKVALFRISKCPYWWALRLPAWALPPNACLPCMVLKRSSIMFSIPGLKAGRIECRRGS